MKNIVLAALSGVALFGIAACSDTDETTTQSTNPPLEEVNPMPVDPNAPAMQAAPPADDTATEPKPVEPAPAQ